MSYFTQSNQNEAVSGWLLVWVWPHTKLHNVGLHKWLTATDFLHSRGEGQLTSAEWGVLKPALQTREREFSPSAGALCRNYCYTQTQQCNWVLHRSQKETYSSQIILSCQSASSTESPHGLSRATETPRPRDRDRETRSWILFMMDVLRALMANCDLISFSSLRL